MQTDKGFDRSTFDKQMAVMRGQVSDNTITITHLLLLPSLPPSLPLPLSPLQILNLTNALETGKTPWQLAKLPPVTIEAIKEGRTRRFIQKFRDRTPFFKGC